MQANINRQVFWQDVFGASVLFPSVIFGNEGVIWSENKLMVVMDFLLINLEELTVDPYSMSYVGFRASIAFFSL